MSSVDISGLCIDHYLHWCVTLGTNGTGNQIHLKVIRHTHTHTREAAMTIAATEAEMAQLFGRCTLQLPIITSPAVKVLIPDRKCVCHYRSAHAFIEGGATFLCLHFSEANEQHVDCFMHCLTTTMFCIATHSTPVGIRPIHVWYSKINTAVSILTHCLTQFHLLDSKCRLMLNGLQNCHQYLLL